MTAEEQIAALTLRVAVLEEFVSALKGILGGTSARGVASERELDGERGDPTIKYDPRDWTGASYVGKKFSQTDPEYLAFLADGAEDYAGYLRRKGDAASLKNAGYRERDARLARGWLARLEKGGWTPPPPPPPATNPWAKPANGASASQTARSASAERVDEINDDEIPF